MGIRKCQMNAHVKQHARSVISSGEKDESQGVNMWRGEGGVACDRRGGKRLARGGREPVRIGA
eukprot:2933501-Pleurochrysis_carterae.AAC.2